MDIDFIDGTIRSYVDQASAKAEVPGGGQFLFRNIQITELKAKP